MKRSEKFRLKALSCEEMAKVAQDSVIRLEWSDIAIEWHTLASQVAEVATLDVDIKE